MGEFLFHKQTPQDWEHFLNENKAKQKKQIDKNPIV